MGHKWDSHPLADWLSRHNDYLSDWIGQQDTTPKDPSVLVQKIQYGDEYGKIEGNQFSGGFTLSVLWSNGHNTLHKVLVEATVVGGRDD